MKELLESKKNELNLQLNQLQESYIAVKGALQVVEDLIREVELPVKSTEPVNDNDASNK